MRRELEGLIKQTVIDICSRLAFVKLCDRKNALVAAEALKDQVVPSLEEQNVQILRTLTNRRTEYFGKK